MFFYHTLREPHIIMYTILLCNSVLQGRVYSSLCLLLDTIYIEEIVVFETSFFVKFFILRNGDTYIHRQIVNIKLSL